MNSKSEKEVDTQEVKQAVRSAIERGESIREDVRNITLNALSKGKLDVKKINQVVRAVMEGASMGADSKGTQVKDSLSESMAGMDQALAKSAEASRLAVEEAASRLKDFGKQDLKRALDDLLTLEDMFLDTIKKIAKESNEVVGGTLNDLVQHARNSGTAVGKSSNEIVETLNRELGQNLAAAGILGGIAETLEAKVTSNTRDDKE
jgi:hypothetical protein